MAQRAHVSNIADYRVTLGDIDLTDKLRPRLVSLSLTEKRGGEADQLEIVIDDADGRMALPKAGALLSVQLGWRQGSDVTPGLIDKGSFTVDEIEHGGPPDVISIRAHSADFTGKLRIRREKAWKDTTLGAVIRDIAGRNGLTPHVSAELAARPLASVTQGRESDMALMRRLGREHDAVATVKRGSLIFAAIGAGVTASGKPLPTIEIQRRSGDRHSYRIEKREEAAGVTAAWHDRKGAKARTVTAGEADGAKRLARTYATKAEAERAAKAERSRIDRAPVKMSFDLALGRADVHPEQRAKVSGFKAEIDAGKWLIAEVAHRLTERGFTTSLQMEVIQ